MSVSGEDTLPPRVAAGARSHGHRLVTYLLLLVLASGGLPGTGAQDGSRTAASRFPERQYGITMASWWVTGFSGSQAKTSLDELAATGAGWVAFVVTQYQRDARATEIGRTSGTVDDDDLVALIGRAHDLGLKVMLKPHVDLESDPSRNRSHIGNEFRNESRWRRWFESYTAFIVHYAVLAAENEVEQFVVGTELAGTSHREDDWRDVVDQVRNVYDGALTYAALDSEAADIEWWDALDLIGVDVYYVLSNAPSPSRNQLERGWQPYLRELANLAGKWDMPIVFTEIGYTSVAGTTTRPWDWNLSGPLDLKEQALAYQTALEVTADMPWFAGMYWWYWDPDLEVGGPRDRGYTPSCKPAGEVLREWYGGSGQAGCHG